jgi:hypothetical protein
LPERGQLPGELVPLPGDFRESLLQLDDAADRGQRHALAHHDYHLLHAHDVVTAVPALTARRTPWRHHLLVVDAAEQRLLDGHIEATWPTV